MSADFFLKIFSLDFARAIAPDKIEKIMMLSNFAENARAFFAKFINP
jgi:hypothetical protein